MSKILILKKKESFIFERIFYIVFLKQIQQPHPHQRPHQHPHRHRRQQQLQHPRQHPRPEHQHLQQPVNK